MAQQRKYPIGIQTFSELRAKGMLYVDKTSYVYNMSHDYKYVFLSRPRRFGKSLLTSTLQSYFEGRKELFDGLAIESLETEWKTHPVLHFDFSGAKSSDLSDVEDMISKQLRNYELIYGRDEEEKRHNTRLAGLIERANKKTGQKVVVLIDEYDSPLLGVIHDEDKLSRLRDIMSNFYSPLKAADPYLRFCFITGITKFSQLSIFSALNNIKNISMMPEYAAICGITKEELRSQMEEDVYLLATKTKRSDEDTFNSLIEYYDGYHFASTSPDIFNPYSLLNSLNDGDIKPYWFDTATPSALIKLLRKSGNIPVSVNAVTVKETSFDMPTERMSNNPTALLYQSGYLTIKSYSPISHNYTLDIPNKEVQIGLSESLLGEYTKTPDELNSLAGEMSARVFYDDMDGALRLMQKAFDELPYCTRAKSEGHFQQLLSMVFILTTTAFVDVEVRTPRGRVDVVLNNRKTIYLLELKLNKSAQTAMSQIDLKEYPARFRRYKLPVVKVAVNFDRTRKNITDWIIQPTTSQLCASCT